jgi:tetratricopeptide (TPR) repeat protein
MRSVKVFLLTLGCFLVAGCLPGIAENVRVWQAPLEIPTYLLGAEDANPPFSLADQRRNYPYTLLDDLTDQRETKSYTAVYLENEYLKVIVLPELGGHLYSLYDKVNKHEVFYRNNVVKYGLISLRGAWVSGGVEFNFPNGHTVVTVSPVAFTTRQDSDGSATVVVGDVDLITEMHWEVALTLRPGQARLEQHVTLFNDTGLTNPYWYWANTAVPATDDMRFIYPMREANPHSHEEIWSFPLHDGVDYSWYKNIRQPTSLFGRQVHRNFFGAYYEKSDYGVVHVADFREVLGKKTWTWGVGDDGLIWTDLLTDHDGPYNEIQAGRFETQLSSELMPPRRVESFTEFWYPLQGLGGGFVEATPSLALNATFFKASAGMPQHVEFSIFPTEAMPGVRLRAKLGSQTLKEYGPVALVPMTTLKLGVPVTDLQAATSKIEITVTGANGQVLLHWSAADPIDGNPDFVPVAGVRAARQKSAEAMSVEELFLSGVEAEKDGNEQTAQATYLAVLKRDPGYIPALVKMAGIEFRAGDFRLAEGFLAPALARDDRNPETLYAAGVVYRAAHRWSEAQDMFWAGIRFGGDLAPAYSQLGEIALTLHNYSQASVLLYQSLSHNPADAMAAADLAVALRLAGRTAEAEKTITQVLEHMPLLPYARAERWVIQTAREKAGQNAAASTQEDWTKPYPASAEVFLQVAAWYRTLGDVDGSDAVLQFALKQLPPQAITPLVFYYLAANAREKGNNEQAEEFARQGEAAPYVKVFPNRLADAEVIDVELRAHPLDSHALYYMGNYLFAHGRYEEGARSWTAAFGQGFEYSVLMRNLGLYAWRMKNDLPNAADFYEKAVNLAPDDYRLYSDLDEIYTRMGSAGRREKLFAEAPASVRQHDPVLLRQALLLAQERQYDRALGLLMDHRFKPWEGGVRIHEIYVLANLQKGMSALGDNLPAGAEAAFRKGLEYPHNLGSGKPDKPRDCELWFWLGESLKAQGKADAARDAWTQAIDEAGGSDPLAILYRGLALRRLGQEDVSAKTLGPLAQVKLGEKHAAAEFYAAGVLDLYDHRNDQATAKFTAALAVDPEFWQARLMLDRMGH